jgi:hypothetical protein
MSEISYRYRADVGPIIFAIDLLFVISLYTLKKLMHRNATQTAERIGTTSVRYQLDAAGVGRYRIDVGPI